MASLKKAKPQCKFSMETTKINNNILISSAGKRVELVFEFQNTLKRYFPESKVLTVDLNPEMAPACRVSDGFFKVPRVTDPKYPGVLLDICRKNNVGLVVPTIDTELLILARNKEVFIKEGVSLLVSDETFIKICRDKRLTNDFFVKNDIRIAEPRDKYNPVFPMFAKPYDGSLSTNIHIIHDLSELTRVILEDPKLMFMEYVDKSIYKEFTVDLYYSKSNDLKCVVPRERIEIRSGEVNKGATRKNYILEYLRKRLNHIEGVIGCICLQVFFREDNNDIIGIEINPRFGGGYPLSYHAGANFQEFIIKEYFFDENVPYFDNWIDNTVMLRYDSQIIFHER